MADFLIVKTSAIGDIVQTFAVVSYLKKRDPTARIDWVVEEAHAPLLQAHPDLDRVLSVETKRWRRRLYCSPELFAFRRQLREREYDAIFDLQGNSKSALFTAMARGNKVGFGWRTVPEKANWLVTAAHFDPSPRLPIQMQYLSVAQAYFDDPEPFTPQEIELLLTESEERQLQRYQEGKCRILVAFGSKWPNKRLKSETLTALLDRIAQELDPVFYFIGGSDEELDEARDLTNHFAPRAILVGKVSLPLLQAVMRQMSWILAVDSSALHLAATTATPTFSIFGPSRSEVYKPVGERHACLQGACPYSREFDSRCPILRTCPTGACIRDLSADEIYQAISKKLFVNQ